MRPTLAVIALLASVLCFGTAPTASAEPTPSTPPPSVVPVPMGVPVEWPVIDVLSATEAIAGVEQMHFSTSNTDGSATETEDATSRTYVLTADVMFAYNKATLTPKAKSTLAQIATRLAAAGASAITVTGHTDSDGADAANLKLSRQRAKTVASFLAARLPAGTTINAVGKGEKKPRATNSTKAGRALNRRVEITIPR